jgi:hypothetical protein
VPARPKQGRSCGSAYIVRVSDQKVLHAFAKPGDYFVSVAPGPTVQEGVAASADPTTSVVRSAPVQKPGGDSRCPDDVGGEGGLFGRNLLDCWTAWELHELATSMCALTDAGHIRQLVQDESADLRDLESDK